MAYPFVASPHVTRTDGRQIDLIVIHTMEMDEKDTTAESCARWFQDPGAKVSAHYCIDNDTIVQCVRDQDVAWAAPGANSNGIQIEHAGRAAQTGRDWSDPYSSAMLERSAQLAADLCRTYRIPVAWLDAADLRAGRRGITTHAAVCEAFKRGSHSDPGKSFPIERYLVAVRVHVSAGGVVPEPAPPSQAAPPTLRPGAKGWQVKRLQKLLQALGFRPGLVDGDFGEITVAAVRAFQALNGLEPDGIVGPLTWNALATATVEAAERQVQIV